MQNPVTPLLIIHASAGGVMLCSGIVAMSARKANNYHRTAGKIYVYAAAIVGISGFIIAVQKSNQFLIATSLFVLYMVATAYRSLYLKKLYKVKRAEPLDWLIITFGAAAAIFLVTLGTFGLYKGNMAGLVPLIFGLLSALLASRDIKKFVQGPDDPKHWLLNHISGMLGSYIAAVTAFLAVNVGAFISGFLLPVWLGPTFIGVPLIIYWRNKYKSKTTDLKQELGLRINTA